MKGLALLTLHAKLAIIRFDAKSMPAIKRQPQRLKTMRERCIRRQKQDNGRS